MRRGGHDVIWRVFGFYLVFIFLMISIASESNFNVIKVCLGGLIVNSKL